MAHEIDFSKGKAAMAYRGEKPWHGLGFTIDEGDDVEAIRVKAGLDFEILKGDVHANRRRRSHKRLQLNR
jgi:hypothetical protein